MEVSIPEKPAKYGDQIISVSRTSKSRIIYQKRPGGLIDDAIIGPNPHIFKTW